jgi:hypothetical protein
MCCRWCTARWTSSCTRSCMPLSAQRRLAGPPPSSSTCCLRQVKRRPLPALCNARQASAGTTHACLATQATKQRDATCTIALACVLVCTATMCPAHTARAAAHPAPAQCPQIPSDRCTCCRRAAASKMLASREPLFAMSPFLWRTSPGVVQPLTLMWPVRHAAKGQLATRSKLEPGGRSGQAWHGRHCSAQRACWQAWSAWHRHHAGLPGAAWCKRDSATVRC